MWSPMTPMGACESGRLVVPMDELAVESASVVSADASVSAAHLVAAYVLIVFMFGLIVHFKFVSCVAKGSGSQA